MITFTVTKNFKTAQIGRQLPFALASALTATVKNAQSAIINSLDDQFTIRSQWWKPSNRFGIKIKAAKKNNPVAEVGTNADWLEKFETGKDKLPRGRSLAIPTDNVRRNKKQIITRGNRPKALRSKRTFVLPTKSGPVLFQRKYRGKRSYIVPLYNLDPKAKIEKNSPVIEPALKSIRDNLNKNFVKSMDQALRTAR